MGNPSLLKAEVTVYSTNWCPDCRDARDVFVGLGVPYREIDIEAVSGAAEEMIALAGGLRRVPTIVIELGEHKEVLIEPDPELLASKLTPVKGC